MKSYFLTKRLTTIATSILAKTFPIQVWSPIKNGWKNSVSVKPSSLALVSTEPSNQREGLHSSGSGKYLALLKNPS